MAEQALPNSPHALALAAYIDERQGNWETVYERSGEGHSALTRETLSFCKD